MEKMIGKSIDQDDVHNQGEINILKNFQSLDYVGAANTSLAGQNQKLQLDLKGMNPQSVRAKDYQSQRGTDRRAAEKLNKVEKPPLTQRGRNKEVEDEKGILKANKKSSNR